MFLRAALESLEQQGVMSRSAGRWMLLRPIEESDLEVAAGLKRMIEIQLECLSEQDREVLEMASSCGRVFSSAAFMADAPAHPAGWAVPNQGFAHDASVADGTGN
jgi:hypothetical protein